MSSCYVCGKVGGDVAYSVDFNGHYLCASCQRELNSRLDKCIDDLVEHARRAKDLEYKRIVTDGPDGPQVAYLAVKPSER